MHTLDHRKKMIIMSAIMASLLFSALNQTTIGTALPRIIADLGGMAYFSWVFTAYILSASIPAVVVGRVSDVYGRKPFILAGLIIFSIGSWLCGLSESIVQLILFRVVQGIGGGIIMATTFAAVGDLFVPRQRGKWQGMLGAMFGLASVFGPALGGWIVDRWHWHWVFWIFMPMGLIAFGMIWYLFPSRTRHEEHTVDYLGAVLLTGILVPLLLAFSVAGRQYAWTSPMVLGLLGASVLSFGLFIRTERRAADPILPLSLFANPSFALSNAITFLMGAGMFGALIYLPLFLQGVQGYTAMHSGMMMVPMTLSLVGASIISGRRMSRTGHYRSLALGGMAATTVGLYLLSWATETSSLGVLIGIVMIIGAGLGIGMPVFTLVVQNALAHRYLGVATASIQLFRQLGGTIGVALMGTILNHSVARQITRNLHAVPGADALPSDLLIRFTHPRILVDPDALHTVTATFPMQDRPLIQALVKTLRHVLEGALSHLFVSASLALAVTVVLVLFLQDIPLRETMELPDKAATSDE